MKKYLIVLLLLVLIIPSVTFASWWNPLSWKIFSFLNKKEQPKAEQDIEQKSSDEKIAELQKQLDELKTEKEIETKSITKETIKEKVVNSENYSNSLSKLLSNNINYYITLKNDFSSLVSSVDSRINNLNILINQTQESIDNPSDDFHFLSKDGTRQISFEEIDRAALKAYIDDKNSSEEYKKILNSYFTRYNNVLIQIKDKQNEILTKKIDKDEFIKWNNFISEANKAGEKDFIDANKIYEDFKDSSDKSDELYIYAWDKISSSIDAYKSQLNKSDYIPTSVSMPLLTVPKSTHCTVNYFENSASVNCY